MQALKRSAHACPGHRKSGPRFMVACNTAGVISAPFDDAGTIPLHASRLKKSDFPPCVLGMHMANSQCHSKPSCAGAGGKAGGHTAVKRLADIAASVKGFTFYTTTLLLALPLFAIMLVLTPFVLLFDKHRRLAQHFVNNMWAKVSTLLYYRVQVIKYIPSLAEGGYSSAA